MALFYLGCVLSVPKPEISKLRKSKVKVSIMISEIFSTNNHQIFPGVKASVI